MIRPLNTLYLLVDGDHARMVSLSRETGDYRTLIERRTGKHPNGNRLGAVFAQFNHARLPAPRSPDAEGYAEFLDRVASEAAELVVQGGFEGLALVAPAKTIGSIRKRLPKSVAVAGELAKDLTKLRDLDLAAWLSTLRPAVAS